MHSAVYALIIAIQVIVGGTQICRADQTESFWLEAAVRHEHTHKARKHSLHHHVAR